MYARAQRILIWWALIGATIYFIVMRFFLHMLPPPTATWSAVQIAQFYIRYNTEIKVGATIASWSSGFMLALVVVITIQMSRLEQKKPLWSIVVCASGTITTLFLVLPPLFFGVAAFTPTRAPEITATIHELALLSFVTTDQYFIFMWVAIAVISLTPNTLIHSPFPRWFGYFTAWTGLMFEAGAPAFLTRTGPFAWNGVLVFWAPVLLFGTWFIVVTILLLRAVNKQSQAAESRIVTTA